MSVAFKKFKMQISQIWFRVEESNANCARRILYWCGWDLCPDFSFMLLEGDRGSSALALVLKTWICSNVIKILGNNLHNANFAIAYAQFCWWETQGEHGKLHAEELSCLGVHKVQEHTTSVVYLLPCSPHVLLAPTSTSSLQLSV